MRELDYLFGMDSRGIREHSGEEALNNNIRDWFANPMHTIPDQPAWGHNLAAYQFAPQGSDTEAMLEMAILNKLPRDVTGLSIAGVRVSWPDIGGCDVLIQHQYGLTRQTIGDLSRE